MDKMFAKKLAEVAENKQDYEQLYVRTKALSNMASQSFKSQWTGTEDSHLTLRFRASLESEFDHSAPLYLKNVTNS